MFRLELLALQTWVSDPNTPKSLFATEKIEGDAQLVVGVVVSLEYLDKQAQGPLALLWEHQERTHISAFRVWRL